MKYIAQIVVSEKDVKEILAKYFGVTVDDISLRYASSQRDGSYVEFTIKRLVDVPGTFDAPLTGNYAQLEGDAK